MTRGMKSVIMKPVVLTAALLAMLSLAGTAGADEAAPEEPGYRELWVPAAHLEEALKTLPRAVLLAPEEFRALVRDGLRLPGKGDPETPPPASLSGIRMEGTLEGAVLRLVATVTAETFAEGWTEMPLPLAGVALGELSVDDRAALRVARPADGPPATVLALGGRGRHEVKAVFHLPVVRGAQGESVRFAVPPAPVGSLTLHLPGDGEVSGTLPFVRGGEEVKFILPAEGGEHEISWSARKAGDLPGAAILQTCRYVYRVDTTRVSADLGLVLSRDLAALPNELRLPVPSGNRVLSVEGSELLGWTLEDGSLLIRLVSGRHAAADLRILMEMDLPAPPGAGGDLEVELPQPVVEGVHRASGTFALFGDEGSLVKRILTNTLTVAAPERIDASLRQAPGFVAGFGFPSVADAPRVTLAGLGRKFNSQLDTLIRLERDAVFLDRTLTLVPTEGEIFETLVQLPEGEEVLDVTPVHEGGDAAGQGVDWLRDPDDVRVIRIGWTGGVSVGESRAVRLTTRRDPEGWHVMGAAPIALDSQSVAITGAEAVSGYVVVRFDPSFRVETQAATGLEPRDGRTTPVEGALAWYRLRDYTLRLAVSRRPAEWDAAVTAYAVPLQGSLEMEGQFDVEILHAPMDRLKVRLPVAVAPQLRLDSPLLAEKQLDPGTGEWTLRLHEERQGTLRLRFHLSVPFAGESDEAGEEDKTFQAALPAISLPGARRQTGHWVMEANTDTELTFDAKGLDPVDSLQVPVVEGYQPRHRVIAAYQGRGDAWSLGISGKRHPSASLVSTVIDELRLDTVASTDGPLRHQLFARVRTAGDQFLEIALPEGARLWTLTLDGSASKPVASPAGTLRIQLPVRDRNAGAVPFEVKAIYETRGKEWGGSGTRRVEPPRFAEGIPVLRAHWGLHLPEGFDYQKFRSNLRQEFEIEDRTLLGAAGFRIRDVFERGGDYLVGLEASHDSFDGYAVAGAVAPAEPMSSPTPALVAMESESRKELELSVEDKPVTTDGLSELAAAPGQAREGMTVTRADNGFDFRQNQGVPGMPAPPETPVQVKKPAELADDSVDRDSPAVSGLVPLDFHLPSSGGRYEFSGLHAPGEVAFRYVDWERQVRLAWLWMLFGAGAFLVIGVRWLGRPLFVGALGVAVLALGPLAAGGFLLNWCNATLLGWIAGGLGWGLWQWFHRTPTSGPPAIEPSTHPL